MRPRGMTVPTDRLKSTWFTLRPPCAPMTVLLDSVVTRPPKVLLRQMPSGKKRGPDGSPRLPRSPRPRPTAIKLRCRLRLWQRSTGSADRYLLSGDDRSRLTSLMVAVTASTTAAATAAAEPVSVRRRRARVSAGDRFKSYVNPLKTPLAKHAPRASLHAAQDGQDVSNPGMPGQVVQHNDTKADRNKEHSAKEVSHGLSHHTTLRFTRACIATTIRKK